MWSIKIIPILISLVLVSCTFAQDTESGICPVRPNSIVESVDVYDGPLSDMAILIPSQTTEARGVWQLAYVYEAGRTVNIRCKYSDMVNVDVNLDKKIELCRYNILKNKNVSLHCK